MALSAALLCHMTAIRFLSARFDKKVEKSVFRDLCEELQFIITPPEFLIFLRL